MPTLVANFDTSATFSPPIFYIARKAQLYCTPTSTGDATDDGPCVNAIIGVNFNHQYKYSGPKDRLVVMLRAER